MPFSRELADHVMEMLEPLGALALKRLFGGACIVYGEATFALIFDDTLYFKADRDNVGAFEAAGSKPFRYQKKDREVIVGSYWRLPDEALDDAEDMQAWARASIDAGLRAVRAKKG